MENVWNKIRMIFMDKILRKRVVFVLLALVAFRLLANIPIPGVDITALERVINNNQLLGAFNILSGGGLSHLSIIMLGVGPYITGSIIMQLLTIMVPRLKSMYQEEGELGKKKFTQYGRILTVPLAIIQGFSLILLLSKQGVLGDLTTFQMIANITIVVGGSMLLMWIGELISEFGIGNGVSLIIFAGIIATIPQNISQFIYTFEVAKLPMYIIFLVVGLLIIAGVVLISEAERPIPVTYAKQVRGYGNAGGVQTYLPLRVNQAGVIPIIFGLSILMFPQILGNLLASSTSSILLSISKGMLWFVNNSYAYAITYFILVFLFTYFYTAITFDPKQLADNLQKGGAFIPGIRPGAATIEYISNILTRITLVGALFLGIIAVLPLVMKGITGITSFALGGTALLIVVSVVLDLIKKVEAQLSMREY
ncbi:MAG: preprotein translocase subunit SecY [Patescibacteria group bacterium]|nr:preprotein translocase subunit SecY [Patescibacteria group bacterium]